MKSRTDEGTKTDIDMADDKDKGQNEIGKGKTGPDEIGLDQNGTGRNETGQNKTGPGQTGQNETGQDETGPEKVRWTREQLDAINIKGKNLLVAAAAGAGKTAVLVERIIQRIIDPIEPVDIDRLLVVTFTNAAATEMKERIGDAISHALDLNPESETLGRQMTLLNGANITTIHSFCLEVIKNNFHLLDIDPNFRIANETEGLLLKLEALDELFEDRYLAEPMDGDFLDLVESYSTNRDDKRLQDMVLGLYNFVQSHPWPKEWLLTHSRDFDISDDGDLGETAWGREVMEAVRIETEGLLESMDRALEIIEDDEGLSPYLENYLRERDGLKAILGPGASTWEGIYESIKGMEFSRLPRCGKNVDEKKRDRVKNIRDGVKSSIKKINEDLFAVEPYEIIRDLRSMYPKMKCLADLVLDLEARYWKKKRAKGLVDFNDLEHLCLNILINKEDGKTRPTPVALALREKFQEVLVDEYQDSNLVQETILRAVSRSDSPKPNMFMVGDVKQSIYRFRQARPELFLEKYGTYPLGGGSANQKIQLFKNFRSRKEILDGINFIFTQIMSKRVGELDYNDSEALSLGAPYKEDEGEESQESRAIELHLLDMKGEAGSGTGEAGSGIGEAGEAEGYEREVNGYFNEDAEGAYDILDGDLGEEDYGGTFPKSTGEPMGIIEGEARIIAERIKELTDFGGRGRPHRIYDKKAGSYRDVEFKDIVILLRTTVNWADTFSEELTLQGIPAFADSGSGYFKTIEVQTMMSLLQIIDNPMQDIPLLAVLRSPIEGWSPEELIDVRLMDRESTLYEALVKKAEEGEASLSKRAQGFLDRLNKWRDMALYLPTDELIWYLFGETGYYSCAGALPGGIQRQANLRILFERARQYEETSYKGLFNFVHYIDRLRTSQGDMGSAKILGENENVVRIMSIHKSKGLEFPVVILAGCGKQFNLMDTRRSILFHQDLGLGPDYVDYDKRVISKTLAKEALRRRITIETLSEEMRILYVALTRAREKLIITGAFKDLGREITGWESGLEAKDTRLPLYETMKARRFLDWIGPAIIRHRDGEPLREICNLNTPNPGGIIDHDSKWEISFYNRSQIKGLKIPETDELKAGDFLWELAEEDELSIKEQIIDRLEWNYPYNHASKLPVKVSVTELKRQLDAEFSEEVASIEREMPVLIKRPSFLEKEAAGLTSAERGSLMHFVLQHLDFKGIDGGAPIDEELTKMVGAQLITENQAKEVDISRIERFLSSPLGRRMLKAREVFKEVPFTIELPSSRLYPELSDSVCHEDGIILQGVIDSYFEEPEGIVLVDYKTDYIPPEGGLELIRERYKSQIEYYTYALEEIRGRKVIEKYIYLFWNGQVLEF